MNIVLFAGLFNAAAVVCAATGRIGPVGAAVTHQLSSFLVMMNSLRLLQIASAAEWKQRLAGWWQRLPFSQGVDRTIGGAATWVNTRFEHFEFSSLATRFVVMVAAHPQASPGKVVALYVLSGLYILGPEEVGVVQRFGRKLPADRQPGLHYKLPWPIDKLTRVQAQRVRVVEIGFRSNAAKGAQSQPLTNGTCSTALAGFRASRRNP